jgi:hypothetical protein
MNQDRKGVFTGLEGAILNFFFKGTLTREILPVFFLIKTRPPTP